MLRVYLCAEAFMAWQFGAKSCFMLSDNFWGIGDLPGWTGKPS